MRAAIKKKQEKVNELIEKLSKATTIAIASLENVSASQLKKIRGEIKGEIIINSKNILQRALTKIGKGYEKLINELKGSCALLVPEKDIFKESIKLDELSVPAFIKSGAIAQEDIIIPEGPTPFMPGELMTMLTAHGVKVSPKGGKITIMEDSTIVKKGETISDEIAFILSKLEIKPIKVKLKLLAAYDGKNLFNEKDLEVNVKEILSNLSAAHSMAVNLSFNAGIINSATINMLLSKGYNEARNLAREAGIILKDNVEEIMLNAKGKAIALANTIKWEVKE